MSIEDQIINRLKSEISRLKAELTGAQSIISDGNLLLEKAVESYEREIDCLKKQLERAKEDRDSLIESLDYWKRSWKLESARAGHAEERIEELNQIIGDILRAEGDDLDIYLRDLKEWYGKE